MACAVGFFVDTMQGSATVLCCHFHFGVLLELTHICSAHAFHEVVSWGCADCMHACECDREHYLQGIS